MRKNKGFTTIELLISLSLFLLILIFALRIISINKRIFYKLKSDEETLEFSFSALEKIKIDVLEAGRLLKSPKLDSIQIHENKLIIKTGEINSRLLENAYKGARVIRVQAPKYFKKNRNILIKGKNNEEISEILKKSGSDLILREPLTFEYKKEETNIILIRKIIYFLDLKKVLRRKVNNSPAQPLIENIDHFEASYSKNQNLLFIKFIKNNKTFKEIIFPKNLFLLRSQSNE
ncbi:hypothetical protein NLB96_01090 [Candidatus Aminicenantes bacterium AC-335-K20]|jgi:hypothetical protein|nr:hypothetical protein [SCandidatus Aminicenantes bacterium Aminicenantia_JdfR_composite]MCP2597036.1 hypothetical protein [Candidatus Aminicenantes bacterium AC-335-G13]MCP2619351.1 hypothetical protein [Candidatus Aminicenantes bacterium AC-335-K20]